MIFSINFQCHCRYNDKKGNRIATVIYVKYFLVLHKKTNNELQGKPFFMEQLDFFVIRLFR